MASGGEDKTREGVHNAHTLYGMHSHACRNAAFHKICARMAPQPPKAV